MTENTVSLAILFADIAQSTRLYDSVGNTAAHALISACIEVMRGVCVTNNGTVIKTIGDEIMCSFPTAEDAVKAARELQPAIVYYKASENAKAAASES